MIRRPRAPLQVATPQPVEAPNGSNANAPSPINESQYQVLGINRLMLSSLPPMASGADIYVRQFYGNALPTRRYLPLKG